MSLSVSLTLPVVLFLVLSGSTSVLTASVHLSLSLVSLSISASSSPNLGGCSPSVGALAPLLAGSGAVCGWGSPRLLQRGTRISNTCSLWQPATTAHCLPTSHFNLKRENCQTNVLATAPCQGCTGNLTAAPARSWSCEGIGEGAWGCCVLVGGPGCHPPCPRWSCAPESLLGIHSGLFPEWELFPS